jgi:hypothetical protein
VSLGGGVWGGGSGGGPNARAQFTRLAAFLEPLAIEPVQRGAFTYAIGASASKLLLGAWACRLGSAGAGRLDWRDPRPFLPLRNVTVYGTIALPTLPCSVAAIIDPALATYPDPIETFYARLEELANATTRVLQLSATGAANTHHRFMAGPYGSLITGFTVFNFTWVAVAAFGRFASASAFPIHDELGDAATDWVRFGGPLWYPVSKGMGSQIITGFSGGVGAPAGMLSYYALPASWGAVADATTYLFRDDMMAATLDLAKWTRAQSAAGNVEIETALPGWCAIQGNGVWGDNGMYSATSVARAVGRQFVIDVFTGDALTGPTVAPNVIVGVSDGAGQSFANFLHGLDFTASAVGGDHWALTVFEGGVSRGEVGPGALGAGANSYLPETIYRVRITLAAAGATYEIQGGPEYPALGGATWTNITPGVTAGAGTPCRIGAAAVTAAMGASVSDAKIV